VAEEVVNMEHIPIGADHAGFALKEKLKALLVDLGYDVEDVGTDSSASVDYADFAHPVAQEVETGKARRGVLLCGTGLGMAYAANRHAHVRAAVVWNREIAALSRSHNDSNVLVLPARYVSDDEGVAILKTWLETPFEGGRHERRIEKIERKEEM
jgi:ribose 5-phosphate isomerase B